MTLMVTLLVTAFVLFFFEIFVPGGILALIASVLILVSAGLAYNEWGLFAAILVCFGGLMGALVMFFVEIRFITKSRFGGQLALQSSIATRLNPRADEKLVGTEGVTLTTLAPSGKVRIDGRVYTASAEEGFLERGTPVTILRSETFKLIVQRK